MSHLLDHLGVPALWQGALMLTALCFLFALADICLLYTSDAADE